MANSFKLMSRSGIIKRTDTGMFIRLADIHIKPDFNNREDNDRTRQANEDLFAFMLAGGIVPELEVTPRDDGGVWVTEGHRRTWSYRQLEAAGQPVEWIAITPSKGNDVDQLARRYTSNNQLPLTVYEQAMGLKQFAPYNLTPDEIAKVIHKSRAHVDMLIDLLNANHDVQQLVKTDLVAPAAAVVRVKEHGSAAGEVLKEDVEAAKAAGKKRVTKSMITEKQFSAKSARRLCELLSSADFTSDITERPAIYVSETVYEEVQVIIKDYLGGK